jgi:DNA-binding CsgD family transcriptional regulator
MAKTEFSRTTPAAKRAWATAPPLTTPTAAALAPPLTTPTAAALAPPLTTPTAKQAMAARCKKRGLSYKLGAAEMKISISAYRMHLEGFRRKMRTQSFQEAILIWNGRRRGNELRDMLAWVKANPHPSRIALKRLAWLLKRAALLAAA